MNRAIEIWCQGDRIVLYGYGAGVRGSVSGDLELV